MSVKLRQSPDEARTRVAHLETVPVRWTMLDPCVGGNRFLKSLLGPDSDGPHSEQRRINWGAICGIGISFVISAGFWAGVGLLLARLS